MGFDRVSVFEAKSIFSYLISAFLFSLYSDPFANVATSSMCLLFTTARFESLENNILAEIKLSLAPVSSMARMLVSPRLMYILSEPFSF